MEENSALKPRTCSRDRNPKASLKALVIRTLHFPRIIDASRHGVLDVAFGFSSSERLVKKVVLDLRFIVVR